MGRSRDLLRRSLDLLADKKLADTGADEALVTAKAAMVGGGGTDRNAEAALERFLKKLETQYAKHADDLERIVLKTGGKTGVRKP